MAKKKKKAKKAKTAKKKAVKNREVLVVASKVKAYIRDMDMNSSAEAITCLSDKVYAMLDEAAIRTRGNGRKTMKAQDL